MYIRKDKCPTLRFKRDNPDLYKNIMTTYAPVFDKITAIEMYIAGEAPPTCETCGCRISVSKKRFKNCTIHSRSNKNNRFTYNEFLEKYPGNYISWEGHKLSHSQISIICPEHGEFSQVISSRINGHGCQKCYFKSKVGKYRIDEDEYMASFLDIHKDRYDYSKVVFCGAEGKIDIICRVHGVFRQTANVHRGGANCPKCALAEQTRLANTEEYKTIQRNRTVNHLIRNPMHRANTAPELKCKDFLTSNGIMFTHQFVLKNPLTSDLWTFDFYLHDRNILLEIDGEYWHTFRDQHNRDRIKDKLAASLGYTVLRISDQNLNFDILFTDNNNMLSHTAKVIQERSKNLKSRKRRENGNHVDKPNSI